jgi:hypothetical protein
MAFALPPGALGAASLEKKAMPLRGLMASGPCPDVAVMTPRSIPIDVGLLRRRLGRLEDHAAGLGWAWDAGLSTLVDQFIAVIESASC